MDFKKFGIVVVILGIVIAMFGGCQVYSNPPGDMIRIWGHDAQDSSVQDKAVTILIAGVILAFVGLGIVSFSPKKE